MSSTGTVVTAKPAQAAAETKDMHSSRQKGLFGEKGATAGQLRRTSVKIDDIRVYHVPHLSEQFSDLKWYPNTVRRTKLDQAASVNWYHQVVSSDKDEIVLLDIARREGLSTSAVAFSRAGPRAKVCWGPGEVKAAIVTCGGLCPGLNDVIEELVDVLYYNYGVDDIYGIRMGYRGFWHPDLQPWRKLKPEDLNRVSSQGGTCLGASRGGFDVDKIINACLEKGVNHIYIVGGDGTHRAANKIYEEAKKRKLKMAVAGIPKTIDNDIGVIDHSFGFNTAVEEARKAVASAIIESQCTPNGIGIVKLMGRHAGYIAAHATLSCGEVDLCLIPEVPFPLHGEVGILKHIQRVIETQGHAVVVVAEGAGEDLFKDVDLGRDESGNKILPDIGHFLMDQFKKHFKSIGTSVSLKYHDPSYMIRSVPANASDSVYCMILAQNAVHGAMAGYTGFTSASTNNRTVMLPMETVTATSPSYLNPLGRTWERVLSQTQQPNWVALRLQNSPLCNPSTLESVRQYPAGSSIKAKL